MTEFTVPAWQYYAAWIILGVLVVALLSAIRLAQSADTRVIKAQNAVTAMDEKMHTLTVQRDDYLKEIADLQQQIEASGQIAPVFTHADPYMPLKIKKPRIK